ncbi:MAG TPA: DUF1015 family protein [Thermoanaerobaculia bacterium]|nr:DUF1015 family protein [Thermoanaerobaculia bacterium]
MELRPFRSIRYSRATIAARGLDALIAPPGAPADSAPAENVAVLTSSSDPEAAAATLKAWLASGILEKERRPGLWSYRQTFDYAGATLVRDALVGLVRLGGTEKGPVLHLEEPDVALRERPLALLRSLKADLSMPLVLTHAPLAGPLTTRRKPDLSATDGTGTRHDAFRITDYAAHVELQGLVKNAEAIIAEGLDLFEAAIEYSKDPAAAKFQGAKYKLCAIVDADSPGLVVAPVHRLVSGVADWNPRDLLYAANDFFEVRQFASAGEAVAALEILSRVRPAFVLVAPPEKPALLALRDRPDALPWPDGRSDAWRAVDAAALEVAFFSRLLAIGPEALARGENVAFTADRSEALAAVERGEAQAAILLRPMAVSEIDTVVHAGESLPRRAATFLPPLFAGLFAYSLEDPVY